MLQVGLLAVLLLLVVVVLLLLGQVPVALFGWESCFRVEGLGVGFQSGLASVLQQGSTSPTHPCAVY